MDLRIWIDTCCIDKTSSAELSEAINSMYRWYENSSICYIYLEDTPQDFDIHRSGGGRIFSILQQCRWVTRGWTLQELIAPSRAHFYFSDWRYIGSKNEQRFIRYLNKITGIETGILAGEVTVTQVSVANRMKWASRRQTSRPEDIAYCLMGIFDVNMPLLYGEGGSKAFLRLQEQILTTIDDQSIFAWKVPREYDNRENHGLLSHSPSYFVDIPSIYLVSTGYSGNKVPWNMTNKGLQLELFLHDYGGRPGERYIAILDCFQDRGELDMEPKNENGNLSPAIHLRRLWGDHFTRVKASICDMVDVDGKYDGGQVSMFVKQNSVSNIPLLKVPDHLRFGLTDEAWRLCSVWPNNMWNVVDGTFLLNLSRAHEIQVMFRFQRQRPGGRSASLHYYNYERDVDILDIAIVLHRTARAGLEPIGFSRPPSGNKGDARVIYDNFNTTWTKFSEEKRNSLVGEYPDRDYVFVTMTRAVQSGRPLYILNLREGHNRMPQELDGEQTLEPTELIRREKLNSNKRRNLLENDMRTLVHPTHPYCSFQKETTRNEDLRHRLQASLRSLIHLESEGARVFCQDILVGNSKKIARILEKDKLTDLNTSLATHHILYVIEYASLTKNPDVVRALLAKGLEPLKKTELGFNMLQLASIFGNSTVVRPILEHPRLIRGHRDLSIFRQHLGSTDGTGDTALHMAAMYCSGDEFELLVMEMIRANGLTLAARVSDQAEINLEREYLFSLRNSRGETVLHSAIATSNLEVVNHICKTTPGVSVRLDNIGRSSMWHAAYGGSLKILQCIETAYTISPWPPLRNLSDDDGLSPLHVACWRGHPECVHALLRLGASPRLVTRELGMTPVHYAALFGHDKCLQAISEYYSSGTSLELQDAINIRASRAGQELFAPIHLAAANGRLRCIRVLAHNGADINTRTPYYYVLRREATTENPTSLLERLVEVNSTAGEIAADEGYAHIAVFLKDFRMLHTNE